MKNFINAGRIFAPSVMFIVWLTSIHAGLATLDGVGTGMLVHPSFDLLAFVLVLVCSLFDWLVFVMGLACIRWRSHWRCCA